MVFKEEKTELCNSQAMEILSRAARKRRAKKTAPLNQNLQTPSSPISMIRTPLGLLSTLISKRTNTAQL
jgi:hypothetical protein